MLGEYLSANKTLQQAYDLLPVLHLGEECICILLQSAPGTLQRVRISGLHPLLQEMCGIKASWRGRLVIGNSWHTCCECKI